MKFKFVLVFTILLLGIIAGCNNEGSEKINDGSKGIKESSEEVNKSTDTASFPTKEAALENFLQNNSQNNETELIKTTDGEEFLIVRYGNHQYSSYGIDNDNGNYSIVKLEAWVSLHNTDKVSSEIATPSGNELTYTIKKIGQTENDINADESNYEYFSLFSGEIKFTLNRGHTLDELGSATPANVIDSTEQLVLSDFSS